MPKERAAVKYAFFMPLAVGLYLLIQIFAPWAFDSLSAQLMEIWGVTTKTLPYAPLWLRTALSSYASLRSLFAAAVGFSAMMVLDVVLG